MILNIIESEDVKLASPESAPHFSVKTEERADIGAKTPIINACFNGKAIGIKL